MLHPNTEIALAGGNPNAPRRTSRMPRIAMASNLLIPSYDEGGDVPENQIAEVHEGEKVLSLKRRDSTVLLRTKLS